MHFEFIKQAMKDVSYSHFFQCEPLTKQERQRLNAIPNLPPSYVEFLDTFGRAKFFRELERDQHHLFVFPPPEKLHFAGDSYMFDVGSMAYSASVAFKFSEFAAGEEPAIYDIAYGVAPGSPRKRDDSFPEWLAKAWGRSRRKYSKKDWARVLAGPEPFSVEELRVIEVRRRFSWRQLPPEDGQIIIEFTNHSEGKLDRYSVGVKDRYNLRMKGGFFVDVSDISPGTTGVVRVPLGGYSHLLTAEIAELFDKGEPTPETRGDFRELAPSQNA